MSSANFGRLTKATPWILFVLILRNVAGYSQSDLLNGLKQYEIVIPSRVTRDGNHVTYSTHPGHSVRRRSIDINRTPIPDDTLHYQLQIEQKDYVIQISPNFKLTSPGFVIERMKNRFGNISDSKFTRLPLEKRNCHYHGHVINGTRTQVAVGVCEGLHGFIHTDEEQYFIEPLRDEQFGPDGQHKHVVYKRSALASELDPLRSLHVHRASAGDESCGVRDSLRSEQRRDRYELHQRRRRKTSEHHRQKRSFSTERYVETFVVVDHNMVQYHKNEHLETYVLTIMNMVAAMFHDASIGNSINIILVRVLLIEEERKDLSITHHADRTLTSFCKFQNKMNFNDDDHPNHHDVAVLFTRKDICSRLDEPCGTLGLAQVSGMCQPHWSCNINEDTGLALAYTVAHEIGHNFGMHHDGPRNGCEDPPGKQLFLMSPSLVADSLTKTWSQCSREAITKFIDRDWGYCLNDEPADHDFKFPVLPSGTMYDANHQCRLQYGKNASICTDEQDVCSNLWCKSDNRCLTRLEAAAEGTICGTNKWCYQGKCVKIGDRPESINGEWGQWTGWSDCTRTCGGGVSHSQRHCDNPQPSHGGKYCLGERKRHRICNTEDCPDNGVSFNQVQCEEFNFIPYKGHYYEWEHVLAADSPCQLHCKPKNRFFSSLLKDIVTDGTPCTPGTPNMCISGRCRHIGCDYAIDSAAKEDRCGVCHGDGSTCTTIKDQFNESKGLGYVEATVIPRGARNIYVEELAEANNFLALQNDEGEYYLNGHWFIQWSGDYEIAGTVVNYTRIGNKESFQAPGPLKEPLHIMLLLQSENPGVAFEYTIPKENISEPRTPTFNWIYLPWTHCTASCGGGTQRSEVVCSEIEAGVVEDKYCLATKPDDKQKVCNDYLCPARWWVGPWQHCSVTCGKDGTHQRTVICVRSMGLDEQIALDDEACDPDSKPAEVEPCHKKEPCPGNSSWIVGEWSKCDSNPCGLKYRSVRCESRAIGCDETAIPQSEMPCSNITCGQWVAEDWTECSVTCGVGQHTRIVRCEGGELCNKDNKPPHTKGCILQPCELATPTTSSAVSKPATTPSTTSLTSISSGLPKVSPTSVVMDTASAASQTYKYTSKSSVIETSVKTTQSSVQKSAVESSTLGVPTESTIITVTSESVGEQSVLPGNNIDAEIEIESIEEIEEGKNKGIDQLHEKIGGDEEDTEEKIEEMSNIYEVEDENLFDNQAEDLSQLKVGETDVKVFDDKIVDKTVEEEPNKLVTTASHSVLISTEKTTTSLSASNSREDENLKSNSETRHKHRHHHGDVFRHSDTHLSDTKHTVSSTETFLNTYNENTDIVSNNNNFTVKEEDDTKILEEDYDEIMEGNTQSGTHVPESSAKKKQDTLVKEKSEKTDMPDNSLAGMPKEKMHNLEQLPSLPVGKNVKIPKLPDISDLPPLPKLEDLKPIPMNTDLTNFDLNGLPKLSNLDQLPQLPDLKDLPKLPNKEELAPIPDLKDLPPLPNMKDLPNKALLPPDIDHPVIDDGSNDKQLSAEDEVPPLEINLPDITKMRDKLPQPTGDKDSTNAVLKPVLKNSGEIINSTNDVNDKSRDLPNRPDISSEISEVTGGQVTDSVLQLEDNLKSSEIKQTPEAQWKPSKWTDCSRLCGDGVRTRTVLCVNEKDEELDDIFCDINTKPTAIEDCFVQECLEWRLSQWSECSATCGHSVRYRNVVCPHEGACNTRKKPLTEEHCIKPDCVKWMSGQWSKCSKKCEGGEQVRLVQCVNLTSQLSSQGCDHSEKPSETQTCNMQPCKDHNAALTIKCEHNKMSSAVCRALRRMGQCHRRFVSLKCCRTCNKDKYQKLNRERPRSRALR